MIKIDPEIKIIELIETYPLLTDLLMEKYEFHCVNCIFSEFDTLKSGAELHGITGEFFNEMLLDIEDTINKF